MKVTKRVGQIIKPLVNFPRWMGLNQLLANGQAIKKMIQDLGVRRPNVRTETFEEAIARLHLTEEDIKKRMQNCLLLSLLYAFFAVVFLIYTIHMIIRLKLGSILGLLITCLMLAFAYREHFWYFQLKTRTLGNSFHDWLAFLFHRGHK